LRGLTAPFFSVQLVQTASQSGRLSVEPRTTNRPVELLSNAGRSNKKSKK
jgi:hypothetical protein